MENHHHFHGKRWEKLRKNLREKIEKLDKVGEKSSAKGGFLMDFPWPSLI